MAIHAASDLVKFLQTPRQESTFHVGDSQLKVIWLLGNIIDADTQISNRYALPAPPIPANEEEL